MQSPRQTVHGRGRQMSIPYLTAGTVLAKLEETAKLREERKNAGRERQEYHQTAGRDCQAA